MAGKLKITLVKSTIGAIPKHRKTVEDPTEKISLPSYFFLPSR